MSESEYTGYQREDFRFFLSLQTRWNDNDIYGHVNNALYYTFFEQVIMRYLEDECELHFDENQVEVFTVESGCQFKSAIKYPQVIEAGLRVNRIGRSSVQYQIGLFIQDDPEVKAIGRVADVFVGIDDERPCAIPEPFRHALEAILVEEPE